jgi:hypothetical protein
MRKQVYVLEGVVQFFIAIGALVSGIMMMARPDGSLMHMPLTMLKGSPFANFFLPGLILFCVNGLGTAIAGVLSFRKSAIAGCGSIFRRGADDLDICASEHDRRRPLAAILVFLPRTPGNTGWFCNSGDRWADQIVMVMRAA